MSLQHNWNTSDKMKPPYPDAPCEIEVPEAYRDTPELAVAWKEGHRVGRIKPLTALCEAVATGSLAALREAVTEVGRAVGPTDNPPTLAAATKSPLIIDDFALARKAHGRLVMEGGFTLDEEGNAAAGNFWAVSAKGFGKTIPGTPSVDEIRAYLRDTPLDGQWFGGWHDRGKGGGETHLDRTQLFGHKHTAIMVAIGNNQKTIYNIETGETVDIPQRAPRRYLYNCECGTFWDAPDCECLNCGNECEPKLAFASP